MVYADFNKAFGTVLCEILVCKLRYDPDEIIAMGGCIWLKSCPRRVLVNGLLYSWEDISSGV